MSNLTVTYETLKKLITKIPSFYIEKGDGFYEIFATGDESLIIASTVTSEDNSDFETNFKSSCTGVASKDDAIVLGQIKNGIPFVQPRLSDGRVRVASEKSAQTRVTFFSPNWCDKTTWYPKSTRVENEIVEVNYDVDGYYADLSHNFIIDTHHGKISSEDFLKDSNGNSYRVSLKINDLSKSEQDPHYATGGDFTLNYNTGKIRFLNSMSLSDVVSATYHYASGSEFIMAPPQDKEMKIEIAEVQFSSDIILKDSVIFQAYGYVDYFAPQYVEALGSGTKIPIGDTTIYKTMMDYINDSLKSYPTYPAMGGDNWRGLQTSTLVMDWDYISSINLNYNAGMEIRIKLQHDTEFEGTYAVASFYCSTI